MVLFVCWLLFPLQENFWKYWSDGKAEINRYIVVQQRYGTNRPAEVFTIYVTEPFDAQKQVKVDNPAQQGQNVVPVLKMNKSKKFQTGIYPYSTMTSVFTSLSPFYTDSAEFPTGSFVKTTFSAQEWCGMTFHQLNRRKNGMESSSYSYFEAEHDNRTLLPLQSSTIFADELFILVRELITPLHTSPVQLYPTLEYRRLFHIPFLAQSVVVQKTDSLFVWNKRRIPVHYWRIGGNTTTWEFVVEKQYPRKILEYRHTQGTVVIESARLKHSARLPYWKLHQPGDERYLKDFMK